MEPNRPRGREKRVTGNSKGVYKRGAGLGAGPVGSADGHSGRGGGSSGGGKRSGGSLKMPLIAILLVALLGGGGGLSGLLSGSLGGGTASTTAPSTAGAGSSGTGTGGFSNAVSGFTGGTSNAAWQNSANTGRLNTSVAPSARAKYTRLRGSGRDTVTVMVYMCGTDLESKYGMGTNDLNEMLAATLSDKVNVIVLTGGCSQWKNSVVSSQVNQIYQVKGGVLLRLEQNAGTAAMTDPNNLAEFIQYCEKNFHADRNALIFWDHGGGSVSGYGYDEKNARSGSMNLDGISYALRAGGVKFDFIGFDACLMATLETALTLTQYADYLIASEETEPGVGWYYTNWLTALSQNTSMPTIEVGRKIADDFVDVCAQTCKGQKTTLSVIDLAELEATVPQELTDFSKSTSRLIQQKEYQTVANARVNTREFAQSSAIDQVDLVHLARNMGTTEGAELADALLGAVKYNRTSGNMTNAYGVSIYFPYQRTNKVDSAVSTYKLIGMDEEYARCIQEFASLEVSGQAVSGGATTALPSLLGALAGGAGASSPSSGSLSSAMISQMLGSFLTGDLSGVSGLAGGGGFLIGRALSTEETAQYLSEHQFNAAALVWTAGDDGTPRLALPQDQWDLVQDLELNLFYDDGEGYIDLGLDNYFEFDENGALMGGADRTWLAIDGQPVAYYYLDTADDGVEYSITGRVPAMLNGERVNLILVFDTENPYGYVAGARFDYRDGETETVAKGTEPLREGDVLEFLCDYYSYDGEYQDSYYLGEALTWTDGLEISNEDVGDGPVQITYRFTDLYHQHYWTPVLEG